MSCYFWPIFTHLPFVTHPGTPKSTSHISDPPFLVGLVEKPDTNPLYKFSLNCSQRFLSWGFCPGVFSLKGFVRGGFCPFPHLSEYICYNRKLNIALNFRFHMYDKKFISVTSDVAFPEKYVTENFRK